MRSYEPAFELDLRFAFSRLILFQYKVSLTVLAITFTFLGDISLDYFFVQSLWFLLAEFIAEYSQI